ncbi:CDP-alcohol phosphatidyltransferase family protein [Hymenobacter properus]|uniref:CDP-alcohol phosphatidyltransferase family protein n=1 Tax=Hymenobacter properus TaxID=2791026 RepID=A0A931FL61_9BACT|nr:CDP-alcohol phosphatidyltransferase family protein [Hymenobacter properus]MBF9143818.1 CDP-alcohol phosphatidyltransferase family protein [Hymenobacter properus]MBR7722631.1 CDP-alcohol phosphatidyltransferase family protein [Microvirga sp. SRT04]
MKRHLPNAITCLNLLCGCLALTNIFAGDLATGAWFVAAAAAADFADGLVARALRVSSAIGKDLDSLADMVSFGVVPGAILFHLLYKSMVSPEPGFHTLVGLAGYVPYVGFLVSIFSALRLAKFNNDTRQTTSFIGLPTPACTLVVASLPLILAYDQFGLHGVVLNPLVLLGLTVLLSGLLVAELPLFALKFKTLRWADNRRRFIFLLLAAGLLLALRAAAVPLVVLLYVLLSVPKTAARSGS